MEKREIDSYCGMVGGIRAEYPQLSALALYSGLVSSHPLGGTCCHLIRALAVFSRSLGCLPAFLLAVLISSCSFLMNKWGGGFEGDSLDLMIK